MSKKIIRDLTPYNTDDERMENQLKAIAARQQEIFSTMLDIVDFFNNVFVGDTEEGEIGGIKSYLVNINRILSVTYNNSIVSIKYKTLDNTERVINFKSNINNNTVEIETGPVIRVVNKTAKDIIAFQNLTKKEGDVIYLEAVDQIILVEEVDGELSSNVPLSDKTLYYYPQGNKIFYKVGKNGQSYFKVGSGLAFDEGFKGENYTPNPENVVRSSDLYNEFRKIWNYLGESQSGNPGYQQPWDEGEDPESGSNTGEVSDSELDANGNPFTIFDYTKGNPGAFAFKKDVENITVEDVDNAYRVGLPPSFIQRGFRSLNDIPIINSESDTRAGLWTANRIGLVAGADYKIQNRNKVIDAIADESCLGFYLDKVYEISPISSSFSGGGVTINGDFKPVASTVSTPVYNQRNNINICKDFIISGAGGGAVKGGFKCRYNLFYTDCSLYLHNFRIHLTQEDTYPTIFINLENGIDQLQIINCEFTSDGYNDHVPVTTYHDKGSKGHYIMLYSPNTRPYKLKQGEEGGYASTAHRSYNGEVVTVREVEDYNYINHIYVKNSSFMGSIMTLYGGTRVVKTARFINNVVTDITTPAIYWGCPNLEEGSFWDMCAMSYGKNLTEGKTYLMGVVNNNGQISYTLPNDNNYFCNTRLAMSCPVYIVGNSFSGGRKDNKPIIFVNQKSGATYICAAILENSASYFLHNTVKDIVTGIYSPEDSTSHNAIETYDTYESCIQVYNVNNTIENIVKFVKGGYGDDNSGVCKSKNCNYHYGRGGFLQIPMSRCYKKNKYSLNRSLMKSVWDAHMASYGDDITSRNYLYDKEVDEQINSDLDKVLSIHFAESVLAGKGSKSEMVYNLYPTRPVTSKGLYHHYLFKEWIFSYNEVDAGEGHIWGMARNNQIPTAKFECKNNKFKASRFSSDLWDERNCFVGASYPPGYIFSVKLAKIPLYGDSVFDVSNNEFTDTNPNSDIDDHARIRFVVNSYYTTEKTYLYNQGALSLTSNCKAPKEGNISTIINNTYNGSKNVIISIDGYDLDANTGNVNNITEFAFNIPSVTPEVPQKDYGDVGRQLGVTEIENPVHGDMYMVEVDGEVKVKEYIDTDSHSILSFRCNTAFKPGTLNVENAVIPLNTSNSNTNISLSASQILMYFGALDEEVRDDQIDEFLQVLNPNIEEGGEGYNTKQTAFNSILNAESYSGKISDLASYITTYGLFAYLNVPADLCVFLKYVLLCNNYTFKGYVNNSNKNTADYVEQTDSKCFDILEQGGSLFVRVVPENDGDDYTVARRYFYTTTSKGSHSIKNVEFANVLSHAAWFPYFANTSNVSWGKYNSTIGTVGGWVISEKNPGVDNKLYYLSQKYGDTEQQEIGG